MKADTQGQGVTVPHKLREFLTNLVAMLPGETSGGRRATKNHIHQLAGAIMDHGQMIARLHTLQLIGLDECKIKIRTCVILAACLDCCREPYARPESAVSPLLPLQTA